MKRIGTTISGLVLVELSNAEERVMLAIEDLFLFRTSKTAPMLSGGDGAAVLDAPVIPKREVVAKKVKPAAPAKKVYPSELAKKAAVKRSKQCAVCGRTFSDESQTNCMKFCGVACKAIGAKQARDGKLAAPPKLVAKPAAVATPPNKAARLDAIRAAAARAEANPREVDHLELARLRHQREQEES